MASLYTQQDSNIRKTWILLIGFFVFVIGFGWVISQIYNDPSILVIAVVFAALMNVFSYWFSDKIVLSMTRAKEISMQNAPELYRIVENLCITAGLSLPKIYIVPEDAPNAFATGRNPEHSVVAVTAGLLKRLDRSELEAVIAHELSHIGNRDMLISTIAVVLVGFTSLLADWFRRSMFWGGFRRRDNDRDNGNLGLILMIVGIALSILAPIGAMLMQLAISRKREFLADASGALLTRYPDALISALQKISADPTPMAYAANQTTAHLWAVDPYKKSDAKTPWIHKMFMTHPPIEDRIKALQGMKV